MNLLKKLTLSVYIYFNLYRAYREKAAELEELKERIKKLQTKYMEVTNV
jgi:hypothetical protein